MENRRQGNRQSLFLNIVHWDCAKSKAADADTSDDGVRLAQTPTLKRVSSAPTVGAGFQDRHAAFGSGQNNEISAEPSSPKRQAIGSNG